MSSAVFVNPKLSCSSIISSSSSSPSSISSFRTSSIKYSNQYIVNNSQEGVYNHNETKYNKTFMGAATIIIGLLLSRFLSSLVRDALLLCIESVVSGIFRLLCLSVIRYKYKQEGDTEYPI